MPAFFSVGPFDEDRFNGLLEGLEVSIISSRALDVENPKLRLDSQFQSKEALGAISLIRARPHEQISDRTKRSLKGKSISYDEEGVFPVVRSGDLVDFINDDSLLRSSDQGDAFFLTSNDILISSIGQGSIGKIHLFRKAGVYATVSEVTVVRLTKYEPAFIAAFLACRYGQAQIHRYVTGATGQLHLYPTDVDRIVFPTLSKGFEQAISEIYDRAIIDRNLADSSQNAAQQAILASLNLSNWVPPKPLTYTASAASAHKVGRLDAQFFAPRIQALLDILTLDGRIILDVASPRRKRFRSDRHEFFNYIEIGDIDGVGGVGSTTLASVDAPSRATWHVQPDDIITSTVRPIRRLSAQIRRDQDGYVCSSGFVVINPRGVPPEVLLTYLRLPIICELLDLYASASMYPAITEADIFDLPLPNFSDEVTQEIVERVKRARAAKERAAQLLNAAKRAVEIAIEDDEESALRFLGELGDS